MEFLVHKLGWSETPSPFSPAYPKEGSYGTLIKLSGSYWTFFWYSIDWDKQGSLISSTLELYPRYFDRFFDDEFFLTIPILYFYFIIFYFLTSKIFSERKNSKLDERAKVIKRSHESNFSGKWIKKKKKKSNVYSQNSIKFKS